MALSNNEIRVVAGLAAVVLAAIVLKIASAGPEKILANGTRISPLQAMIIEKGTSTYSLANVQLYVWLFSAVAVYLYFLAAKVFAQREFYLADFPPELLGVATISVSTTVLASGVSSLNGGKGSGDFQPRPSDLISSGGDVAPERVQQLLWTLIAAPAFVVFAYMSDPLHVTQIQGVPDHFLQLMGISSAGYIAGKVARGAGPKITSLTATLGPVDKPALTCARSAQPG